MGGLFAAQALRAIRLSGFWAARKTLTDLVAATLDTRPASKQLHLRLLFSAGGATQRLPRQPSRELGFRQVRTPLGGG